MSLGEANGGEARVNCISRSESVLECFLPKSARFLLLRVASWLFYGLN